MTILQQLKSLSRVIIRQRRELAEIFGFETRNKYAIETEDGAQLAFAAEQQKGFIGILFRQALGHWRTYDIHIFDTQRNLALIAHHPFRFYYQRLEVRSAEGSLLGRLERRFEIFGKRFDLIDATENVIMTVRSPLWRIWTFPFKRNGADCAVVTKKWGGVLKEVFLDADSFALDFTDPNLSAEQRALLLAAGIFIDLRYFENKASGGVSTIFDALMPG